MRNHVVIFRSDLRFDGRVNSMIRTLSLAYPDDRVYLFELVRKGNYKLPAFPENVISKRPFLFFKLVKIPVLSRIGCILEFYIYAFIFLLLKRPASIQLHYEVTLLPATLFKLLSPRTKLIYNDQELYHYKDSNISKFLFTVEYYTIKLSDLVIITNKYRKKALYYLMKNQIRKSILIDNYVFEPFSDRLDVELMNTINHLKQTGNKIILHQGVIAVSRGEAVLRNIVEIIPPEWSVVFIGVSDELFQKFKDSVRIESRNKIVNLGYVKYSQLNTIYSYIDAAMLFYESDTFNNKYCAPNRLYSAVNNGIPVIVNNDNVSLNDFVESYENGISISEKDYIEKTESFFQAYDFYKDHAMEMKGNYQYGNVLPDLLSYYSHL